MQRIISLFALALTAVATTAEAQQQLRLANGDQLTGTLTGVSGGAWVFTHAGGELKLAHGNIASFTSASPVGVRLADGSILAGTINTVGGQLQINQAGGAARTVAMGDLAAVGDPTNLAALEPKRVGYFSPLADFWGATASLGFSNKSGNSRSRGLGANVNVARISPKDRITLKLGTAREEADVGSGTLDKTVEKYFGSLRVDVFFGPRFFVFGGTAQERDRFQDIDLRSNYNAGFGLQVIATPETDLRFYTSGGYRREAFTSGGTASTETVGLGAGLTQQLGPAVFAWSVDMTPSLNELADYRLLSDASLTIAVYKGLGFRIGSRNEINNRPPAGVEKHDMLLTTSLTYSIGR